MKLSALFLSVLIVFNNIQLAVFAAAVEPQQESKEYNKAIELYRQALYANKKVKDEAFSPGICINWLASVTNRSSTRHTEQSRVEGI